MILEISFKIIFKKTYNITNLLKKHYFVLEESNYQSVTNKTIKEIVLFVEATKIKKPLKLDWELSNSLILQLGRIVVDKSSSEKR